MTFKEKHIIYFVCFLKLQDKIYYLLMKNSRISKTVLKNQRMFSVL